MSVRAELKGLHSPDIKDLEGWHPDGADFGFLLQMVVGPSGGRGSESFDLLVYTPGWLANEMQEATIRSGAYTLFVKSYDYRALTAYLEKFVRRCEGDTWQQVTSRLGGLAHWEFDQYDPRTQ